MREGDTRASEEEGRKESSSSSPFCSKSRSRQRGGERRQVSPSHPFFLSPSPPSPPLPRAPASPAPTLSSLYLAANFTPGTPGRVPSPPSLSPPPLPPSQGARVDGGAKSPKSLFPGDAPLLLALSLPVRVNNPLWHGVSASFSSSPQTKCCEGSTPEDKGAYTIGGGARASLSLHPGSANSDSPSSTQHAKTSHRDSSDRNPRPTQRSLW